MPSLLIIKAAFHDLVNQVVSERDAEWCRALGIIPPGIHIPILTPKQAAEWLKNDRIERARNVADASRPKGRPQRY